MKERTIVFKKMTFIICALIAITFISVCVFAFITLNSMMYPPVERMNSEIQAFEQLLKKEGIIDKKVNFSYDIQKNGEYSILDANEYIYDVSSDSALTFKYQNVLFELNLVWVDNIYNVSLEVGDTNLEKITFDEKVKINRLLEITNEFYHSDAFSSSRIEKMYNSTYLKENYENIKYSHNNSSLASYKAISYDEPSTANNRCSYVYYVTDDGLNNVYLEKIIITLDRVADYEFMQTAYVVNDYEN